MVLPLIAAGIGAAGNIVGGLMGASAQKKAQEQNYAIALMNYYAQETARREAQWEAQRQEREGKLGTTDAQGNRTYYKAGVGWVTELSPESEELSDLYRQEEIAQLSQDLPAQRKQMFANLARQGREENVAGGLMEAMLRNYRDDPEASINRKNQMSAEGINEGMDNAMRYALRESMRTGSGNAGRIASSIGKQSADSMRKAFMENQEGARQEADDSFMTEQGNLANLYNAFASRASGMPNVQYNPRNLEGASAQQLQQAMTSGRGASENLLRAMGSNPAQFDFQAEPQYGLANTIAQAGSSLSAGLNYYDSTRGGNQYGAPNAGYSARYPSAPAGGTRNADFYKQNVGLW